MRVIDVDRIEGDVLITFEDGVTVRFSGELLREMAARAQVLPETDPELVDPKEQ